MGGGVAMLLFIDLTNQIAEGVFMFAWYDVARDMFVKVAGEHTWHSWESFALDYLVTSEKPRFPLEQFRQLFPVRDANENLSNP